MWSRLSIHNHATCNVELTHEAQMLNELIEKCFERKQMRNLRKRRFPRKKKRARNEHTFNSVFALNNIIGMSGNRFRLPKHTYESQHSSSDVRLCIFVCMCMRIRLRLRFNVYCALIPIRIYR